MKSYDFKKGEEVVCILNFRTSLKIGETYIIEQSDDGMVMVRCDNGKNKFYDYYESSRFIPKSEYRSQLIKIII